MPLNPAKVALVVQKGLSIYCATCTRYWEAADKGLSYCGRSCKGPPGGGIFPEYDGPIRDHTRQCFACGQATKYVVTGGRDFGVCEKHVHLFNEVEVPGPVTIKLEGHVITPESLVRKPVKSVARAIYEVESYYAMKEGRPLP